MAGYSGAPLWKKLGLKPGMRATLVDAPDGYVNRLGPDAPEPAWEALSGGTEFIQVFTKSRSGLKAQLEASLLKMARSGMVWVSWPKKASKISSEVTEDVVRELALPMGLVDVKVCSVDETWSGLKLVIRKELR